MTRYLAAIREFMWGPIFVLSAMALASPVYLMPYTGKGPPGTYAKADRIPPAPPIAEIGPKIESRLVKVERIQRAAITPVHEKSTLPWSCETIRAAVEKLTPQQMAVLARVYRLTDQQKAAAARCLKENRT